MTKSGNQFSYVWCVLLGSEYRERVMFTFLLTPFSKSVLLVIPSQNIVGILSPPERQLMEVTLLPGYNDRLTSYITVNY